MGGVGGAAVGDAGAAVGVGGLRYGGVCSEYGGVVFTLLSRALLSQRSKGPLSRCVSFSPHRLLATSITVERKLTSRLEVAIW